MGVRETYVSTNKVAAVNSGNKLTDSDNKFLTEGFRPGVIFEALGFTEAGNNAIMVAGDITATGPQEMVVVTEVALVDDAADTEITLTMYPQSFRDCFTYGQMAIYTGSQPASADVAPTGTLLLLITEVSVVLVPGGVANGLSWDEPAAGVLGKDGTVWSDVGLATGTAGWFRFYANDYRIAGSGLNFDGAVGTSGAELNLSSTSIVLAATTTIDEFEVTLPLS